VSKIAFLGKNNCNLLNILEKYDNELDGVNEIIKFDGKTLDQCSKEQVAHEVYYNQRCSELKILLEHFKNELERMKARFAKKMKDNNMRDLSDRMIGILANNDNEYNVTMGLYLEVKEVYEKYNDVVNAFTSRGFVLGHITKARIAGIHGDII